MAKQQPEVSQWGRVIIFGNPNYTFDSEQQAYIAEMPGDKSPMVEVLDVQRIEKDRIITSKYVLPIADASSCTSDDGMVYCYNCSLPYIQETAHLAEVEKNTIVQQAFLYAGRTAPVRTSGLVWVLVGFLGLLALVGMFN